MKYAKSDKGYYIPKGQGPEPKGQTATPATDVPTTSQTSLSFEDANYQMTKDNFGNELYIPKQLETTSALDWNAPSGSNLFGKAYAYKKANDGTFIPVVYDMQANKIDDFLTKEMAGSLSGGMQVSGSTAVKAQDLGKLMYKRAIAPYQSGVKGEFVSKAQKAGSGTMAAPPAGKSIMLEPGQ